MSNFFKRAGTASVAVGVYNLADLVAAYQPIRDAAVATGDLMTQGVGYMAYPFINYPVESAVILGTPTLIAAGKGIYNRIKRR